MAASGGAAAVLEIFLIVTPSFNMAATVGFLDPFRAANYLAGSPLHRWRVASAAGGEVAASNGLKLVTLPLAAAGGWPPGERQNPSRTEPVGSSAPAKLKAAMRLMERRTEDLLAIPEIAAQSGLSQRQLERLFLTHTGLSPVAYDRDIRLDRARGLVTQTDMKLTEVALACGFASPEHFSRAYRGRFGLAPRRDRVEGRVPFEFRAWPMHLRGWRSG